MQLTLSMAIMQLTTSVAFMQDLRWYFVTGMLVDLSVAIIKVTISVDYFLLVSAANTWVTVFIVIIVDGSLCCNYAGVIFCSALYT